MPPNPPPSIDIVTVAIALAATMFSPGIAAVVGPYAVILLGATLGGAWAASRQTQPDRMATVWHILGCIGIALIVTVPASELVASRWGLESRWTLGPVALVIGGVGKDWPGVFRWCVWAAKKAVLMWARSGGSNGGPQP